MLFRQIQQNGFTSFWNISEPKSMTENINGIKNSFNQSIPSCLQPLSLNTLNTVFPQELCMYKAPSFPVAAPAYNPALRSLSESLLCSNSKFFHTKENDTSNQSTSAYKTFYENWLHYFLLLVQQNNLNSNIKSVEELQKHLEVDSHQRQMMIKTEYSSKEVSCSDWLSADFPTIPTSVTKIDNLLNKNNVNTVLNPEYQCEESLNQDESTLSHTKDGLLMNNQSITYDSESETESLSSTLNENLADLDNASHEQMDDESIHTSSKSQRLKSMIQEKEDGVSLSEDLEEIYQFAHLFKLRRLSLGLTQTQVGASLNAKEGPAYSQSAICRFEKLDVTLKSAKRMKPVLERWLSETEAMHTNGTNDSFGAQLIHRPPRKRKRRTCFSTRALNCLLHQLEKNPYPTKAEMTELAKALTYDREVIRVWFCNRRQAIKTTEKHPKSVQS
ncbi:unnamed protein product [Trichobilharzia szidati]|nr:unnamed protein product [Trichobilharzia szidati]